MVTTKTTHTFEKKGILEQAELQSYERQMLKTNTQILQRPPAAGCCLIWVIVVSLLLLNLG